jgi:two-component system phosphate regulon sensor histidine kinase PhoR
LIEIQKVKEEFSANVSHELKTPLQSIIGYTELFENNLVKPEDSGKFIGNIKKESLRLVALINDIIHLSELDEIEKVSFEKVNLAEVISETISLLTSSASKRNVTLHFENIIGNGIVQGVPSYIQEIVYNLIDNAIKFSNDGGTISIDISRENDDLVFKISNGGETIKEEDCQKIFDKFYRANQAQTDGHGIGLSIVKKIVELHSGCVSAKSCDGLTTFIVSLPINR